MILFEGQDIRVVARLVGSASNDLVITFTGRSAKPPAEMGFGEAYLTKKGVSAIHFISKANHWWQTPEPLQAIEKIKDSGLLNDRRVVCYGSSMGGYAALIYSSIIKPEEIILFSPQYSIDARKVPFEHRWRNYASQVTFDYDDMHAGIDYDASIKVIFDPLFKPDACHVDLVEALRPIDRVPVRFAGHNTARVLSELNMIKETTDALIMGTFDTRAFSRRYRQDRDSACLYWHGLSETLMQHQHEAGAAVTAIMAAVILEKGGRMHDRSLKLDILHAAVVAAQTLERADLVAAYVSEIGSVDPEGHRTAFVRAIALRMAGEPDSALAAIRAALASKGSEIVYCALHMELLVETGGHSEAMTFVTSLPTRLRESPTLRVATAKILMSQEQFAEAKDTLRLACREKRRNVEARVLLARCWALTARPDAAPKQLAPLLDRVIARPELAREVVELLGNAGFAMSAKRFWARQKRFSAICDVVFQANTQGYADVQMYVAQLRSRARSVQIAPD
jgi:hypothetical protein